MTSSGEINPNKTFLKGDVLECIVETDLFLVLVSLENSAKGNIKLRKDKENVSATFIYLIYLLQLFLQNLVVNK